MRVEQRLQSLDVVNAGLRLALQALGV
jgi:hypothetical protein